MSYSGYQYEPGAWNAICTLCGEQKSADAFYYHCNGKPRKQCKVCRNLQNTSWKKANPDRVWKPQGDSYVKALEATRRWRVQNLAYDAARAQEYRARKLQQMPAWADKLAIAKFYELCPEGHHVDHVIPLKGVKVRGLHVLENLQYLPARENLAKRNIYHVL